jgi:hypothetical protein
MSNRPIGPEAQSVFHNVASDLSCAPVNRSVGRLNVIISPSKIKKGGQLLHSDTRKVAEHMKNFSFHLLGKAIYDATFTEMTDPFAHVLSVVHAAHGAELLVKARIAQEHPLLVFNSYPRSSTTEDMLSIRELFERGKTLIYSELPEVLWATIGYRIKHLTRFQSFGNLRNSIVHLATPQIPADTETLRFVFEIMDQIAYDFWNESFVGYSCAWDDGGITEQGLLKGLDELGIEVHPLTRQMIEKWQ